MNAKLLVVFMLASISAYSSATEGNEEEGCAGCTIDSMDFSMKNEADWMKISKPKHPGDFKNCILTTSKKSCIEIKKDLQGEAKLHVKCQKGLLKLNQVYEGCDKFEEAKKNEDVQILLGASGLLEIPCPPTQGKYCAGKDIDFSKYKNDMQKGSGKTHCDLLKLEFGNDAVELETESVVSCPKPTIG